MKEYIKNTKVANCRTCLFRKSDGHDMHCGHPFFDNHEDPYACLIVSQFTLDSFPIKCPLQLETETKIIQTITVK